MSNQSITDPVQPVDDSSGHETIHPKPLKSKFGLAIHEILLLIGAAILVILFIYAFIFLY